LVSDENFFVIDGVVSQKNCFMREYSIQLRDCTELSKVNIFNEMLWDYRGYILRI